MLIRFLLRLRPLIVTLFVVFTLCPRVFSQKSTPDHKWVLPLRTKTVVTSCYGPRRLMHKFKDFHQGIDLSAHLKTPVQSIADGKVIWVGNAGCAGRTVVVEHELSNHRTIFSIYKHLRKYFVKAGERVSQGEVFALSGASGTPLLPTQRPGHRGCVEGAHLHFELKEIRPGHRAEQIHEILHKTRGHISNNVIPTDPSMFWPELRCHNRISTTI